jgi:hypothetical protein
MIHVWRYPPGPEPAFFIVDGYVFPYGGVRGLYQIVDDFWFPLETPGAGPAFWRHGDFIYAYPVAGDPAYWVTP